MPNKEPEIIIEFEYRPDPQVFPPSCFLCRLPIEGEIISFILPDRRKFSFHREHYQQLAWSMVMFYNEHVEPVSTPLEN